MKKHLLILGIIIIVFVAATMVNYTRLESKLTVNEKITLGSVSQEIVHDLFGADFKIILEPGQSLLYKADTMLT